MTVYPGGCFGPHDPYLGDQNFRLRWVVLGRFPLWPAGGYHATDVRTVAEVVVAAMEPGRGPRRFVVPGVHLDASTLYGTVASVTGRYFPHLVLPRRVVAPMTASVDALQRLLPASWHFPADHEGAMVSLADTRMVDSATRTELGIQPRPFEETIRDTLVWMVESGHISRRAAGRAVPTHA
jgi:nucleoside-diphosphate-sugar epimerase